MSAEPSDLLPDSKNHQRELLNELLVRELPNIRKGVSARIWKEDLARDPDAVSRLADDVLQEVAKRVLENAHKFNPALSGHAWLDIFALNILHEYRRQIYYERKLGLAVDSTAGPLLEELISDSKITIPDIDSELESSSAEELLKLVSSEDQALLRARYLLNQQPKEIAQKFGLAIGAVYTRISRARDRLRLALRDQNREEN